MMIDGEYLAMGMAPNPRAAVTAALVAGKKVVDWTKRNAKNVSLDGPESEKLSLHGKGRIVQLRWKGGKFVLRLDLHPLKGSNDRILHINYGPSKGSEKQHLPIFNAEKILDWMDK